MKLSVKKGTLADAKTQAVIVGLFEDGADLTGPAREVDEKTDGLISDIVAGHDFEAKHGQVLVLYTRALPAKRIALIGFGKKNDFDLEKLRMAFARAARHLRDLNIKQAATSIDFDLLTDDSDRVFRAAAEGILLGLYRYAPFKTTDCEDMKDLEEMSIIAEEKDVSRIGHAIRNAQVLARAVYFARDLVSAPGNALTPSILAEKAREIAAGRRISCTVLDKARMKKLGMDLLLGVASGSSEPPQFIILEYRGGRKKDAPIALVGKGLTFDSGGLIIKPGDKMDEMKTDMAGGAAVMAAIMASAGLQLPLNIIGFVPAAENMPGGGAFRPGDVLRSYSGKTVEIINTDAEGRLILADALSYALTFKPHVIIDVATLTGACAIALGNDVTGIFGRDDGLKSEIVRAAQMTGERVWELPLWKSYDEYIKSDIADYKNWGGREGGAIIAAAFLDKFTGDVPWLHLDIAGPAWTDKDKAYVPKGASGVGVRLLVEFLSNRAGKPPL